MSRALEDQRAARVPSDDQREAVDPYKTLQLDRQAPRVLVEEAYWLLVARNQQQPDSAFDVLGIQDLNDAYALLMDQEQRDAYDLFLPPREPDAPSIAARPRSRWQRILRKRQSETVRERPYDFYRVLMIDREADDEMIVLAARVFLTHRARLSYDVDRDFIEEARDTLLEPQMRQAHDAFLIRMDEAKASGHVTIAMPIGAAAKHGVAGAVEAPSGPTGAAAPRAIDAAPPKRSTAPSSFSVPPMPAVPEVPEHMASRSHRRAIRPKTTAGSATGASAVLPTRRDHSSPVMAAIAAIDAGMVGVGNDGSRSADVVRPSTTQPAITVDARDISVNPDRAAIAPASAVAAPDATNRLAQSAVAEHQARKDEDLAAIAALCFIRGPRAGDRISLHAASCTVGSGSDADVVLETSDDGVAAAHVRIWKQGEQFIMQRVTGAHTTIGNVSMGLLPVVLNNGDQISIGRHELRFVAATEERVEAPRA